jgi:ABC-type antimicrobial peptide transport system permease subunit
MPVNVLALALVGLYGLVAYSVARRTQEIGIRMALGLAGVLLGGVMSAAIARLVTAALAGLGAPNPAMYAVAPQLVIGLTVAASYIPARRASRVDPLRALRSE